MSTLRINERTTRSGIHRDPHCPLPAMLCGNTLWRLTASGWVRTALGGRLFLADGLWGLEYGPHDIVLLDGNFAHGVTTLRTLSRAGQHIGRPQMERYSIILFNRFQREKLKAGHKYTGEWPATRLRWNPKKVTETHSTTLPLTSDFPVACRWCP